jgi:lipopolysaccharide transport system permease protein
MRVFPANPAEMVASFWRNRNLIHASAKREVLGRYRGSSLGLLWSFFNPLFMIIIYTFVFSEIFKARWSAENDSKTEFALVLFAGLFVFNFFAECINRAPALVVSNPNYVKKVVFPLEILPFVSMLSSAYHMTISLCVWLLAYIILFGFPHATVLLFPLIMLPFALFILGLSWALASLGVFLRDVSQFIGLVVIALMFLSPIFYPTSALPEFYQHIIYINPLTSVIELTRDVLYWGVLPNFQILIIFSFTTAIISWLGFAWFQKTRTGFADVI